MFVFLGGRLRWMLAVGLGLAIVGRAQDPADLSALRSAQVEDLPGEALRLLEGVEGEARIPLTRSVLETVHEVAPSSLVKVMGVLARQAPASAPAMAAQGVVMAEGQAAGIAGALTASAPWYSDRILTALCTNAPAQFAEVTVAVARLAPEASHSILHALGQALPDVKDYLERAKTLVSSGRSTIPPVCLVVYQAVDLIESEGEGEAGAVIAAKFREE